MANKLVLRVQSKTGRFVVDSLLPDSTFWSLQQQLERKTGIRPHAQKVLHGYPPKEVTTYSPTVSLSQLHLTSGETLIVSELDPTRHRHPSTGGDSLHNKGKELRHTLSTGRQIGTPDVVDLTLTEELGTSEVGSRTALSVEPIPEPSTSGTSEVGQQGDTRAEGSSQLRREGESTEARTGGQMGNCTLLPYAQPKLVRKIVPADNSCLFRCISYLISDGRDSPSELRQLAAGIILSNPDRYSAAVLGRSSEQYIQWLLKEESWGGAIELSVFSEYYQIELDAVDIQTQRIDRFGEDRGYAERALLLYDGIHYDPLVMEGLGGTFTQKIFPITDDSVLVMASHLAREAQQARQYTDVSHFTLRCLACGAAIRGQTEAQNHARATGHVNFGEV